MAGTMRIIKNPAQLVVIAFVGLILVGTALLALPVATDDGSGASFEDALFVSTSATTVTGLSSVDIGSFSEFGELVILALIQVGGFGIMTIGSVVALIAIRRVGLRQRMLAQAEIGAIDMGELSRLLWAIARITLFVEGTLAAILFVRMWQGGYEDGPGDALYSAVFHAISTFNNAGISLYSDSMTQFVGDVWVVIPVTIGFIIGGLGFPVLVEMYRRSRQGRGSVIRDLPAALRGSSSRAAPWSLHLRLTLVATVVLLVIGPLMIVAFEWTNPATLGALPTHDKILAGWFQGVTPRTAGFNTVDFGAMNETTLLGTAVLMFIGAGSASTSGGIKVSTAAVVVVVIWAEVRGESEANVFRRRLPTALIRQAMTIITLAIVFVVTTSLMLMASDGLPLTSALFESTSAFGTVGLSTGVTGSISVFGHLVLVVVMISGRVGPVTFVTALALRERARLYKNPEERVIIG